MSKTSRHTLFQHTKKAISKDKTSLTQKDVSSNSKVPKTLSSGKYP